MGILSQLVGQLSGFGLNYLNDYLVQKRLEDTMRQSSNYLTGTAVPEYQAATTSQEQRLQGQSIPPVSSLLGVSKPIQVAEPGSQEALTNAQMVKYNPQVPSNIPMTPYLQQTIGGLATQFAGQPPAIAGEMQKAQEEKSKNFRDLFKIGLDATKGYEQWVPAGTRMKNIGQFVVSGGDYRKLVQDFPQEVISDMETRQAITQAGGTAGARERAQLAPDIVAGKIGLAGGESRARGYGSQMGEYQAKEEKGIPLTGAKEPKEVSPHMGQDMMDQLQRDNPEYFSQAPTVVPGKGLVYKPLPQARAIVSKALNIYKTQNVRDMYGALEQAKGMQPPTPQGPQGKSGALPVPEDQRGKFQEGQSYNYKGKKYIYRQGVMVPQ